MGTAIEEPPVKSTSLAPLNEVAIADQLGLRKAEIAEIAKKYGSLTVAADGTGRTECHVARMDVRTRRVAVEKRGKELRADAVKFQKAVIAAENELVALLTPIETRLKKEVDEYDAEQARIAKEAHEAAMAILVGKVDALAEYGYTTTTYDVEAMEPAEYDEVLGKARLAFEERVKAEAEAAKEAERIAAEEKAERDRLEAERKAREDAERAKLNAEQEKLARNSSRIAALHKVNHQCELADVEVMTDQEFEILLKTATSDFEAAKKLAEEEKAKAAAEAKQLADDRAAFEAEKKNLADEEAERQRHIEAKRLADEAAEREAAEAKRLEELRPDREKIEAYAAKLLAVEFPELTCENAPDVLMLLRVTINGCADDVRVIARDLK